MKWVHTLYSQISCKITNNGWLSSILHISRGIRQGCPISALLFVITVETMAVRLRQEESIHGLKFYNTQAKEFKISQLADDTTLFLRSKSDITNALNIIDIFGSLSGLILNREKSQGIKLGDKGIIEDNFEKIDWSSTEVKALGTGCFINYVTILNLYIIKISTLNCLTSKYYKNIVICILFGIKIYPYFNNLGLSYETLKKAHFL